MPRRRDKLNSSDFRKWPRELREKLYRQMVAEEAAERAAELEAQGWRVWYATIFGEEFASNLAPHHAEALEWHWNTVVLKRAGITPSPNAYFAVWPRGHRKSDHIRHIAVADACLLRRGYCLYVSSSRGKVHEHALSIERLIHCDGVRDYYPDLSKVDKTLTGTQRSWTSDRMISEIGYTFHFVGLKEGVAGANVDNVRPSLVVLDDVDEREDSPLISEQRLKVLTRSVLPTRQRNTVFFSAQNYISRHGIIHQIHTGKVPALSNRVITKPIPAFYDLVTEHRTVDGLPRDIIVSGTPSWPHYTLQAGQAEIDDIGLAAFKVEMQHEVDEDKSGAILPEYDEAVHVITWSQFNARYNLPPENRDVPQHWRKFCGYDHGASEGHDTAVSWLAVAGQNGPLPSTIFFYKLMSGGPGILSGSIARQILDYLLAPLQANPATYLELGLLERATADPGDVMAASIRTRIAAYLAQRQDFAMFHASHEQLDLRNTLRMIYGLPFQACNPKRTGGVEQWRHYLRPDMAEPHPFKPDATGLCRFYMIVEDAQLEKAVDDAGLKLARTELPEWRWRTPIETVSGLMDERPAKKFDNVANCLVAGTLVKTEHGDIPIEDVQVGQKVWTREGLNRVLWSGQTGALEPVFDVELSNGTILTGTTHHPVWTDEGWTLLKCLREGDRLFAWQDQNLSSTVALNTDAIPMQKAGAIGITSLRISPTVVKAISNFMSRCGKMLTGRCQKAIAFTIGMKIQLTTFLKTFSALPKPSMLDSIWLSVRLRLSDWLNLLQSSLWPWRGIEPLKAASGIDNMPVKLPTMLGLINSFVPSAAMSSCQRKRPNSVKFSVHGGSGITSNVFVKQVKPSGEQPVYNLEVDNCPEFFANGVLVHNSIQMILTHFKLTATPLTHAERVEAAIPPHLRYAELLKNSPFERGLTPEQELAHLFAVQRAQRGTQRGRIQQFDEDGRLVTGT